MNTTDAEIAGKRKLTIHQYLTGRRKAIEGSIAAEVLAGNTFKESCERTALAEITALECEIGRSGITLCRAVVGRVDGKNEKLQKIFNALDNHLGDTDPDILEDATDDEIRDEEPVFWAANEIAKYSRRTNDHLHSHTADGAGMVLLCVK